MIQRRYSIGAVGLAAALSVLAGSAFMSAPHNTAYAQGTGTPLTGYAWSDTIGWISLSGSTYGISFDSNGDMSGYAWSDTIGWISANTGDLTGCPSGSCRAKLSGNGLQGWLKALAGGSSQSGGWNGWISLKGSSPAYGVTENANGTFAGYAWGSDVVGWINFSYASTTYGITDLCPNINGNQTTVPAGYIVDSSGQCVNYCTPLSYCSGDDVIPRIIQNNTCIDAAPQTCSYQCANGGCISPPPPIFNPASPASGHLRVNPLIVRGSDRVKVFWDISNVSGCTVTPSNGSAWTVAGTKGNNWTSTPGPAGQTSASITERTTFTLTCTGLDGSQTAPESATVNIAPVFREI